MSTSASWSRFSAGPGSLRHFPPIAYILLFYVAYTVAGGFARQMQIIPGHTTAFWPPAGIFVATLLSTRRDTWGWWVLVGCLAEMTANVLWFRNTIPAALGFYLANALEALTAAWLLRRFGRDPFSLESVREVAAYVLLGAGLATMVGATVGSATHALFGTRAFSSVWLLWWLGDGAGLLISGPLALTVIQLWQSRADLDLGRAIEALAVTVALVVGGIAVFNGYLLTAYVLLPPMLWAAVRFQLRGAAVALALTTLITASYTIGGQGEFSGRPDLMMTRILELKTFLSVAAISTLIVGALSHMHGRALSEVEQINAGLERLVSERTASLETSEARLRAIGDNLPETAVCQYSREPDGRRRFLHVSAGIEHLTGVRTADVLRDPGLLHTQIDESYRGALADAEERSARELSDFDLDVPLRRADGEVRWIRMKSRPRRAPDGRVVWDGVLVDITERKKLEEQMKFLMHEVNHRAKNILSLVQAIARQTAAEPRDFVARFGQRLQAVAANLDLLVQSHWSGVEVETLVAAQLTPFKDLIGTRIKVSGPPARFTAAAAQSVGLALHELATNASKYGALSDERGSVQVSWRIDGTSFFFEWKERDGPIVSLPTRRGFGSTVLDVMVTRTVMGRVSLDYAPEGLVWQLSCPIDKALELGRAGGD